MNNVDELLKRLQSCADWQQGETLSVAEVRMILDLIQRQDRALDEKSDEIDELHFELSDAWAQVLHG